MLGKGSSLAKECYNMIKNIHSEIEKKLDKFLTTKKVPNILFHGSSGSGKRTIVNNYINKIYSNDKTKIKKNVMNVNCSHGKGIKFIREDLKFFSKTHISLNTSNNFKTIIFVYFYRRMIFFIYFQFNFFEVIFFFTKM